MKKVFRNYNISPNLESMPDHNSLDNIEYSSIFNSFTSDNVFIKATLDLSFKSRNFFPELIPRLYVLG